MSYEPNDPTQAGLAVADMPAPSVMSRNEIETLCAKAARGAGLSWGHAEEAGFAAGWLHSQGIDGAAALLAHLQSAAGKAWTDVCPRVGVGKWKAPRRDPICPIALGAALSDHCELPEGDLNRELTTGPVDHPVLVIPFLSRIAALLGGAVRVRFDGGEVGVGPDRVSGDTDRLSTLPSAALMMSQSAHSPGGSPSPNYRCARATFQALANLALQTTVPPSDRSRADAGAGTSDND